MSLENKLFALLPGLDCGLCGSASGCRDYAKKLSLNEVRPDLCLPGGETLRSRLVECLAEVTIGSVPQVSLLLCQGDRQRSLPRYEYKGVGTCRAAMLAWGGPQQCLYGCLHFGDCAAACPNNAIILTKHGLPKIDYSRCKGCGSCVGACPKQILHLSSKTQQIFMACSNQSQAEKLTGKCSQGCTSCGICLEICPFGAIKWEGSLPKIDHQRCRSCSICVIKCPPRSYIDRIPIRPTAFIGLQCNGCGQCKAVCPTDCIIGKKNEHHKVIRGQCIGCGLCFEVCPQKAVTMLGALGHVDLNRF